MTLPHFLAGPGTLDEVCRGGEVVIEGPEARHAVSVRRIGVGESVRVGDGAGRVVTGEVTGVASASPGATALLAVRADEVVDEPAPDPRFVLVQALAKHDRDLQAIEAATEIGVDAVIPWQAARSIVRWRGSRGDKARAKWQAMVTSAAKQSRRAWVPLVEPAVTTALLVARFRDQSGPVASVLVLHEDATEPLAAVALPVTGDVVVIVGPEGGIDPDELDSLVAAGAHAVRLGSSVLRSSSAGPAALAVLSAASRWR